MAEQWMENFNAHSIKYSESSVQKSTLEGKAQGTTKVSDASQLTVDRLSMP